MRLARLSLTLLVAVPGHAQAVSAQEWLTSFRPHPGCASLIRAVPSEAADRAMATLILGGGSDVMRNAAP
jgi:hypothetical protein